MCTAVLFQVGSVKQNLGVSLFLFCFFVSFQWWKSQPSIINAVIVLIEFLLACLSDHFSFTLTSQSGCCIFTLCK